ncbi:hypothetical protein ACFLU5_10900 [Bacteroidota bacterium]
MISQEKPKPKVHFPLKGSIVWSVRILIVIVLLLTATQLALNVYSNEIIGSILKKYVEIKFRKLYTLNFEECNLNFLGGELTFNEIYLLPDPFEFNKRQKGKNPNYTLFEIYLPYAKVSGNGLKAILGNRSLQIEDLDISQPYIKYISYQQKPLIEKTGTQIGSTFNLGLSNQLEILQIENGSIQEGRFHLVLYEDDTVYEAILNNINIELSHLVADSLTVGSFYHALSIRDLIFSMDNNKIDLPNSPYSINIGDLTYSSAERNLNIRGFELEKKRNTETLTDDPLMIDYIRLAELELHDIDLEKLVADREISIDKLILIEPESHLVIKRNQRLKQSGDPFESMFKFINKMQINAIDVESAQFSLDNDIAGKLTNILKVEDISMNLDHLLFDTASYKIRRPRFFVDDFKLQAGNQVISFPESIKDMSLAGIHISSYDNSINVSDLRFSIEVNEANSAINGDFIIPEMVFTDLNIWKVIHDKKLEAQKIALNNVKADLKIKNTVSEIDTTNVIIENNDKSILEAFSGTDIKHLELNHVNLNVNYQENSDTHILDIRDLNSRLTQIVYDSAYLNDTLNNLIFDQLDFAVHEIAYLLNDTAMFLFCEEILGEKNLSKLDLSSLNYVDKNGIKLDFNKLGIYGFSFSEFFNNKHIIVEDLILNQPSFQIVNNKNLEHEEETDLIRRIPYSIDILNSSIDNGNIKWMPAQGNETLGSVGEFSFYMKAFHLDSFPNPGESEQFSFDDMRIQGSGIQMQAFDNSHDLQISDIKLSALDSILFVNDITLSPSDSIPTTYSAKIKSGHINNIDVLNIINSDEVIIPEVILQDPKISITKFSDDNNNGLISTEKTPKSLTLPMFEKIRLQSFNIINGGFEFKDNSSGGGQYLYLKKINSFVQKLNLDETFFKYPEQFLFSSRLSFEGEQLIYQTPDDEYTVTLDNIYISSLDSLITGNNFHMLPRKFGAEVSSLEIYSPDFSVSGMDLYNLASNRVLNSNKILLQNPEIHYTGEKMKADLPEQKTSNEISIDLGGKLQEININKIEIPNGQLIFNESNTSGSESHIIENMNIGISGIHISDEMRYETPFELARNIELTMNGIDLPLNSPYYSLYIGDVEFSSLNKSVSVKNIELIPFTGKTEFAEHFEYQVTWMNIIRSNVDVHGINLNEALNGNLVADKITISEADLEVYKDKNYPFDENNAPQLPISALKKAPFKVIVDSVEIENSIINYSEFAERGHNPGTIIFDDLNVLVLNVTNDSISILDSRYCSMNAQSMLMGKGKVDVNFEFDLSSIDDYHTINGTLNAMNLKDMNHFMENVAFARITGGTNNEMIFNMDFNSRISTGSMRFNYDDLKVTFIDKESSKTGVDEAMGAFVANTFIIRKDNPRYIIIRKGDVYFYRNMQRSVFHYWAQSLLSGIQSSVGPKINQKKIDKRALSRSSNLE